MGRLEGWTRGWSLGTLRMASVSLSVKLRRLKIDQELLVKGKGNLERAE